MTTYLLHGGATTPENKDNTNYFKQCTARVNKKEVNILMCYWARTEEEKPRVLKRDQDKIIKYAVKGKKVNFAVAADDPHDLFTKLPSADVLFVIGGDPKLIEPYYPHLTHLRSSLENKIYMGSSMGAFLTSSSYVVSSSKFKRNFVQKGVGLLPIQLLCHWDVEKHKQLKLDLLKKHSDLPILTLDEHKFVEIYL